MLTAVLSELDALVDTQPSSMTLVARAVQPLADDGLAPSEADLAADGLFSTSVAVFGTASLPALDWLASNLRGSATVGQLLARAAQLFGVEVCTDESIGVGRWRWDCDEPALLDLDRFDTRSPWTLDPEVLRPSAHRGAGSCRASGGARARRRRNLPVAERRCAFREDWRSTQS